MKVVTVRHMIKTDEVSQGKDVWIDEGGGYTSGISDIISLLAGEVADLLEESCEAILITSADLTDAEYAELMEAGEFQGW